MSEKTYIVLFCVEGVENTMILCYSWQLYPDTQRYGFSLVNTPSMLDTFIFYFRDCIFTGGKFTMLQTWLWCLCKNGWSIIERSTPYFPRQQGWHWYCLQVNICGYFFQKEHTTKSVSLLFLYSLFVFLFNVYTSIALWCIWFTVYTLRSHKNQKKKTWISYKFCS